MAQQFNPKLSFNLQPQPGQQGLGLGTGRGLNLAGPSTGGGLNQGGGIGGARNGLTGTTAAPTGLTGLAPAPTGLTGANKPVLTIGQTGLTAPSSIQPGLAGLMSQPGQTGLAGLASSQSGLTGLTSQPGQTGLTGLAGSTSQPGQIGLAGLTSVQPGQTGLTIGKTGQMSLTGLTTTQPGQTGLTTTQPGQTGLTGLTTTQPGQIKLTTGLTAPQTGLKTGLGTIGQPSLGTSKTGLGTGLTSLTTTSGIGLTTTTSATGPRVTGLGGVNQDITQKSQVQSVSAGALPDEFGQLVSQFETFLANLKSTSDTISKSSETFEKKFRSVGDHIDTQQQQATVVSQELHQLNHSLSSLKDETHKEGRVLEIAQRTRELPTGLQHENTTPDEYFKETVDHFEKRMRMFRNQLEELESYLHAVSASSYSSQSLGPGDIISALNAQYRPFLVLAARLQVIHEEIQRLKEQYINLRRLMGLDSTDLFVATSNEQSKKSDKKSSESQVGPSPFAASIAQATAALTAMATAGQFGNSGIGIGTGGIGTSLGGIGPSLGGIGTNTGGIGTGIGGIRPGNAGIGLPGPTTGIGMGANRMGMGTSGLGMGTGLSSGIGTTGLGASGGIGMGLGNTGLRTGAGLGTGIGTGLGGGAGMGTGLSGIGTGGLGGMGTGLGGLGGGTGLSVAGTTKPFQLKPPPPGKRK